MPEKSKCGPKLTLISRIVNAGVSILFFASAILQYNDGPKGWIWAFVYTLAGILCVLAELRFQTLRRYIFRPAVVLFGLGCFIASWFPFSKQDGHDMNSMNGREFLGLMLVAIWMGVVIVLDRLHIVGIPFTRLGAEKEEIDS
jgi:hypothetical protein